MSSNGRPLGFPEGGYLEDRRPASDADPYQVAHRIMQIEKVPHQKVLESIG